MRRVTVLVFVLSSSLCLAQDSVQVVGVTDGDTLTILTREKVQIKVRLDGVDAPESRQPFGSASKEWLSDHVFGQVVKFKDAGKDRYGRTLGRIWVNGKRINYEIVRAGMAWWYRKYSKDKVLKQCEWEARQAKRGVWSEPDPIAPWDWRNGGRSSASQRAYGSSTIKADASKKVAGIVYVTSTGERYHKAGCRYLGKSTIPMKKSDAVKFYRPCSICGGS